MGVKPLGSVPGIQVLVMPRRSAAARADRNFGWKLGREVGFGPSSAVARMACGDAAMNAMAVVAAEQTAQDSDLRSAAVRSRRAGY